MNEFNHGGFTVSPTITIDDVTGEEVYGEPEVIDNSYKEAVHQERRLNENESVEDAEGNETNVVRYDGFDADYLMEEVGGEENYLAMITWASENLSAEMIDEYDVVMQRGDIAETHNYMQQLKALYNENQEVRGEAESFQEHFYNNVISPSDWDELTKYMYNNFEQEECQYIKHTLDSGNYSEFEALVQNALQRYQAHNN